MSEIQVQSLGQDDPLEKEMTTHSSILAWAIPQTEEPGGLQLMGSQECVYMYLYISLYIYIYIYLKNLKCVLRF